MAKTEHYYTKFEEGSFYHVYNRSIDKQPMFRNKGNYQFFLKKYDEYLSPVVDTFAYCLLGNHFHILLRVRRMIELSPASVPLQNLSKVKTAHDIVSHQFRKFFQSYAMAFNKQHNRVGTLFQTPFKRSLVSMESYFTQMVYYIHCNPQQHGLVNDFREWEWSSYNRMLLEKSSRLKKEEVIGWFGDVDKYRKYHMERGGAFIDKILLLDNEE